ncbi:MULTISPECIES: phenylalanine--tRNA ligase subunit alpha [unclassified Staphylococcus]|uniref:phenylalanine--tRNA ligase subunit alpha n=1 Tax=unclassified Staphylococcus TaxID=91994 RepID=UPI0021D17EF2|nr:MULTISPECIES: phenylalanine--tRNA ligase subunit alpha [unclassified Staphylococcus]UXR70237.1 phenylalanine--tRNA ligase subunit alpha [Staphylococcus sp. IVB6246]UXR72300.1 phenylalanine--tRNA ligase subunit alpha [Staphylococcus sp. IVB6240]UXR74605.1 phenylalanine--tRNA ligase subunit alpha [Staphylococcus sp. IVB6238]UXR76993.1 phenylalanine--tRNA ligase subunit alpha [Staphylococcus sp. IVB6233]UXR81118.1 phenylalanine--tRNA ligase subunit alpha [Staphylococcus sp. IVB6218]
MVQTDEMTTIKQDALEAVEQAQDAQALQAVKVQYLGKKGLVTGLMKHMKDLPKEEKPAYGQKVNEVRQAIEAAIETRQVTLNEAALNEQLAQESIDVTLPGRPVANGAAHPLTRTIEEIEDLFLGLGYEIVTGYEVEQDYYNFEALNLPKSHPARDMQDSFYITEDILMRTHTSPVQARTLEQRNGKGPVKIICPGKVYRRDSDDATHSHQFTQIEGLVVDENIKMSDLKGTLELLAKSLFGADREIRLRPSYFPFTEPSVEVDVSCFKCKGKGCNVCKQTGWIEILGAGMVHPNVLEMAGFDSKKYSGFAFGMGPDRIAMLKYGIEDIRHFYTNDVRFLNQFKGVEDRGETTC